jgi:arginyl-tRNA synthetase
MEKVAQKLGLDKTKFNIASEEKFGHYSANLMMIKTSSAEARKMSPNEFAEKFKDELSKLKAIKEIMDKIEIAGSGYLNFWLKPESIQKDFVEIFKKKAQWGKLIKGERKTVVIDYSHPNIAKPMSVAHLRSTIIGQAFYNIFKFRGWRTIGDNHLGDWGKQFGILIAAFKQSDLKNKKDFKIEDLMNLYVDYAARMKNNSELEDKAREETKKLQLGDKENIKIWKKFYKISLNEFKKVYKRLDIKFDYYLGESFYNPMLEGIVNDALKNGVARISEGAVVIPMDNNQPPFIIRKSDEAYLYSTTDLAAIKYRMKKFKTDLVLYVVDNGQSLHFEQLFKSAEKLGLAGKEKLFHVKFGLVLSEDLKKLSTRAGRHISLQEVIDEAVSRARKVAEEKQPDLESKEKQKIAEAIGIGALKYNDLSQNRMSDIAFKWEKMLNLEGNSAPYLQYTYARLKSILRKAKPVVRFDQKFLNSEIETEIILRLSEFPDILDLVIKNYLPHYLAEYLYKLAQEANLFYQKEKVLAAPKGEREARLALTQAIAITLKTGLGLLGIKTLERI